MAQLPVRRSSVYVPTEATDMAPEQSGFCRGEDWLVDDMKRKTIRRPRKLFKMLEKQHSYKLTYKIWE